MPTGHADSARVVRPFPYKIKQLKPICIAPVPCLPPVVRAVRPAGGGDDEAECTVELACHGHPARLSNCHQPPLADALPLTLHCATDPLPTHTGERERLTRTVGIHHRPAAKVSVDEVPVFRVPNIMSSEARKRFELFWGKLF